MPAVGWLYPYSPSFARVPWLKSLVTATPPPSHTHVPPFLFPPSPQTLTHVSSRCRPGQSCLSASLVCFSVCAQHPRPKRKNNICLHIIRCCFCRFVGSALSVSSSLKGRKKAASFHSRRLRNCEFGGEKKHFTWLKRTTALQYWIMSSMCRGLAVPPRLWARLHSW